MKSIVVNYIKETDVIELKDGAEEENWVAVCKIFNDDVHKVRQVNEHEDYNWLYECFDDNSKSFFYIVREEKELYDLRRKTFLSKLGKG